MRPLDEDDSVTEEIAGGERAFKRTVERDRKKVAVAKEKDFNLIVIPHFRFHEIPVILSEAITS